MFSLQIVIIVSLLQSEQFHQVIQADALRNLENQAKNGITVNRMSEILGRPRWLIPERVIEFGVIGGFVPVNCKIGQTVYFLALTDDRKQGIYLTVDGRINRDELYACLMRTADNRLLATKGSLKIVDMARIK